MSTRGKKGWILAFSIPCLVLFCLVYAIPFVMVITTSFCDYSLTQSPVFEGLKNFKTIFADPDFSVSIVNTLKWVLIQSTLHVGFGFVMALILRRKPKGWKFVRVAYVIPNIIPTAATAVMFSLLLNPSFGVIKIIYEKFGLDTSQVLNLFGNSKYAFITVTATWVFYSGFNMLIFMGEMGAISPDIYEAAMIDGATPTQADRYITITVCFVAMCAYVVARYNFKLKTILVLLISASLMLPVQAISQPLFAIFKTLGLYDTKLGLIIVYAAMGIPMSFFVMVSYYKTIPVALEESAYIDGATFIQSFTKIILPLAKPGLATIAMLQFINTWNEFYFALMLTSGDTARTVPIALNYYLGTFANNYSALFAAVIITVLPTIIIFIILQKQVMESMTAGAVKG